MKYFLYHANCNDGFCAAWMHWRNNPPEWTYIPVQYGEPMPEMPDAKQVLIVDFSYDKETLLKLHERVPVLVIDHHATAQKDLAGLDFSIFDMDRSGAGLMCDTFGYERNIIVDAVEDRDLWRFALSNTREIDIALRQHEFDFYTWTRCYEDIYHLIEQGKTLLRFQKKLVSEHVKHARDFVIGGYQGKAVWCTPSALISDIGSEICGDTFGAILIPSGDKVIVSLRSRSGYNVGNLAKSFGGGGHPQAAGFTVNFIDIFLQASLVRFA